MKTLICSAFLILLLISCKRNEEDPIAVNKDSMT